MLFYFVLKRHRSPPTPTKKENKTMTETVPELVLIVGVVFLFILCCFMAFLSAWAVSNTSRLLVIVKKMRQENLQLEQEREATARAIDELHIEGPNRTISVMADDRFVFSLMVCNGRAHLPVVSAGEIEQVVDRDRLTTLVA